MSARPVVFIHGMYMNGQSWAPWVARFSAAGFSCEAPSWPYHDGDPAQLRETLHPDLGRLTFPDIVEHYEALIDGMASRPLLVGHSIGGLVVQKLVNEGYAAAGVAISSAPARGILSFSPHFVRANFPHINPLAGNRPIRMTPSRFHYTFCNLLDRGQSDELFERYVVPESRNVPRSTLRKKAAIDFRRPHAPLLMIAGDRDHLTPMPAVRRNAAAYRRSPDPVEFVVFPGRCHAICNQDGWQEVADRSIEFLRPFARG